MHQGGRQWNSCMEHISKDPCVLDCAKPNTNHFMSSTQYPKEARLRVLQMCVLRNELNSKDSSAMIQIQICLIWKALFHRAFTLAPDSHRWSTREGSVAKKSRKWYIQCS